MSTVTFENVCRAHTKRQVIIKINKFNMFITAVCVLFLIKLRWPKNKSILEMSVSARVQTQLSNMYRTKIHLNIVSRVSSINYA